MIIKKYQGKTEAEAMENAKKELGEGIVLMNVKTVKPKGFSKIFKSAYIEITVAKEEEREITVRKDHKEEEKPQSTTATSVKEETKNVQVTNEERILEEKLDNLHSLLEKQIQRREDNKVSVEKEEKSEEKVNKENKEDEQDRTEAVLSLIRETLVDNEVDPKYANSILEEVEKMLKPNMPMEHIYPMYIRE